MVGHLRADPSGRMAFTYDEKWLQSPGDQGGSCARCRDERSRPGRRYRDYLHLIMYITLVFFGRVSGACGVFTSSAPGYPEKSSVDVC
jgi:hypothetical protein